MKHDPTDMDPASAPPSETRSKPSLESDWESDWERNERAQFRAFQALSFSDKVRAVEGMQETAAYLLKKTRKRRTDLKPDQ